MVMLQSHVLLISEDAGNGPALSHARERLDEGYRVTWICSTPTSAALSALEDIAALKNAHLANLNLLVITRNERQPFAVLTGELDAERLTRCADLLFDSSDVDNCTIVAPAQRAESVATWASNHLPKATLTTLDLEPPAESATADAAPAIEANTVEVKVIMQGREVRFSMLRTAGTLLDGAEDAGLDLPFSCRGGVCSTCRTQLREGEVELMENYALEEWELDAGFTLPCQAEPISDQITLDYDEV